MGRPEKIVAQEDKVDICNLNATKNMGAKKISKLKKFKEVGYNKIGRIIKDCPKILASAIGSDTLTNRAAPSGVLISPSVSGELNQTGTGSSSNQWKLKGAESMLSSDFSPEGSDSDSDNNDMDPNLGYYSPIQPIQPSMVSPAGFLNGLVNGLNTTLNSRMHSWIADWADRVTRPLFPNLFPNQQEKTTYEKLSEIIDKRQAVKPTGRELNTADDSVEETGSCSCLDDERDSIDTSEQKSTGNADSPIVDRVNVEEVNHSGPPSEKAISGESSVGTSTAGSGVAPPPLPEKSKEEQNTSTQQSVSGNVNQSLLVPPPPPPSGESDIASPGTNNRPDTITTPPPAGTEEKTKNPLDGDNRSNSTTQNHEQKPPGQNSAGNGTITDQYQLPIGAQVPVTVENIQAPPFKPVDHVSAVHLPGTSADASAPIDPSTDNHPPDGKGEEKLDFLGQAGGRTDTNQQSFDRSDLIVPGILIGLATALIAGVVKPFNNQNKQPETRTEVRELPNPKLNVKEKKKPPPPLLYSIQLQGEAAGTRIF